ncbi:type II secretion system GspH family protein [bacterium]|nr:type II secretion system GspH family protein [bacterium]
MIKKNERAYVLVEILAAMTILAISGSVLMRSLQNAMGATRSVQDITKAIYLTEAKLNEFKIAYNSKMDPELGEFRGNYSQPGASKFHWTAWVEHDRKLDAYVITVSTTWGEGSSKRRRRRARDLEGGFVLKSMAPRARINEDLILGGVPSVGSRRPSNSAGRSERGSRGSR